MHLVIQVLAASRVFEKEAQRIFRPHGLSAAQFNVLHLISVEAAGMRASDIARGLIVDPSNVTGLLRRMKQVGFLKEIENSGDRRQHVVTWTAKGKAAWDAANRDYQRNLEALGSVVSPANRAAAERVLKQLTEAVGSIK